MRPKTFAKIKQQCLNKEDLSRKGSIDDAIRSLVDIINADQSYYTTSTCSGRISLIEKPKGNPALKKGGNFLLNSHQEIELLEFQDKIRDFIENCRNEPNRDSCLWLKYEPFILHVQCIDLKSAHDLLNVAIAAGCRNSGLTLGKSDKFLVAIRSTSSMEVPIHSEHDFVLEDQYITFLCNECNRRLRQNFVKLAKFHAAVAALFEVKNLEKIESNEAPNEAQ